MAGTVTGTDGELAAELRRTMDALRFQEVLDLTPRSTAAARSAERAGGAAGTDGAGEVGAGEVDKDAVAADGRTRAAAAEAAAAPKRIAQQPQINATVIRLDRLGRPVASGTVLMSPRYPHGRVVPVDADLHTTDVRWREWDDAGWDAHHGQGTVDVVPGRENASTDFMLPYPASVLKLMVNFGVLRLVDQGKVRLDDTYRYRPTATSSLCGGPTSKKIRAYMDASLTWSSNSDSCALVKLLHDHGAVDDLNRTFHDLGLETLRLKDTSPANGGHWTNAITMSSLDTAKLLLLVNGAPGTVWTAPDGRPVTSDVLSAASRRFFRSELGQQGLNEVLSTTNWCGRKYPAKGIPQLTPTRWIGAGGKVTVAGARYGRDVRPCNASAEVTFAHKTGLVRNSGADAGIVRAIDGKPWRSYIIVLFSNLGVRYQDPGRPPTPPGVTPVSYTERLAKLGRAMDRYAITAARTENR